MKKVTATIALGAADKPAELVRVRTEPNTIDDLIRDAIRNAREAEVKGDRLHFNEYLWLIGELETIRRQVNGLVRTAAFAGATSLSI